MKTLIFLIASSLFIGCPTLGDNNPLSYEILLEASKHQGDALPGPETIVYITETGNKYHKADCQYLRLSKIPTTLAKAIMNDYQPCSVCKPPKFILSDKKGTVINRINNRSGHEVYFQIYSMALLN